MAELNPVLLREAEKMRRSRFYKLRKLGSHGRSSVRRYHVPVHPSYREISEFGVPVGIQLPKGARFAKLHPFDDKRSVALWFMAPEEEVTEVRYFVISRNDNLVEPQHGYNLHHVASEPWQDDSEMLHLFESERTDTRREPT